MRTRQVMSVVVAAAMTVASLGLTYSRGGALAWAGLIAGIGLLLKIYLQPRRWDPALCVGAAATWALVWAGTLYYVISTWESGEVVELTIDSPDGARTARLWALDIDGAPVVYYDAGPETAQALLSGKPVQFKRRDQETRRCPDAVRAEDLPEPQMATLVDQMQEKYQERNAATGIYYAMLGRPRDRVPVVATLSECGGEEGPRQRVLPTSASSSTP